MSTQDRNYTLDFAGSLPVSAQEGMAIAYDHADTFWRNIFGHCIFQAARRLPELTVDDVLDELEAINVQRKMAGQSLISTHNLDALGPAMMRARSEGIIASTGNKIRSKVGKKHGNLRSVWKSNFYAGEKQ